jgi:hypothetical protein
LWLRHTPSTAPAGGVSTAKQASTAGHNRPKTYLCTACSLHSQSCSMQCARTDILCPCQSSTCAAVRPISTVHTLQLRRPPPH